MNRATRWPTSTAVITLGLLATRRRRITLGSWGGISCARDGAWVGDDPGGPECLAAVPPNAEHAVILAADDCPSERIFIEVGP